MSFYEKFLEAYPQYKEIQISSEAKTFLTQTGLIDLSILLQSNSQLETYVYESYDRKYNIGPLQLKQMFNFSQYYPDSRRASSDYNILQDFLHSTERLEVNLNL